LFANRNKPLLRGCPEYCVQYLGKIFIFTDPNNMQLFLKKPERYAHVSLPEDIPMTKAPIMDVTSS